MNWGNHLIKWYLDQSEVWITKDSRVVQEDPDSLGYFIGSHPFIQDYRPLAEVADELKIPDTVPAWLTI